MLHTPLKVPHQGGALKVLKGRAKHQIGEAISLDSLENSCDAEVIVKGDSAKGPNRASVSRHGPYTLWGYGGPDDGSLFDEQQTGSNRFLPGGESNQADFAERSYRGDEGSVEEIPLDHVDDHIHTFGMTQFTRGLFDGALETLVAVALSPVAQNTIRADGGWKFLFFRYADTRYDVCSHGLRQLDRRHSDPA